MKRPESIKALRDSGYQPVTVKQEMRRNLVSLIEKGENLFPGIVGYEKTVLPQIENAMLSGHDFILLGLRGQAKTRILRQLVRFLDEWVPAIEGCEVNDDPLNPICPACKRRVAAEGDQVPVRWIHRDDRYRPDPVRCGNVCFEVLDQSRHGSLGKSIHARSIAGDGLQRHSMQGALPTLRTR